MRFEIIERLSCLDVGSWSLFGHQFSEKLAKIIKAIVFLYFCYMLAFWVSEWENYSKEENCIKSFALLWIAQCSCTFLFQLCCYLERYYRCLMILVVSDAAGLRRARYKANAMFGCKLLAYSCCSELTVVGCMWFSKKLNCLSKLNEDSIVVVTLAFWLLTSSVCCLIYAARILTLQIFYVDARNTMQADNNEHLAVNQDEGQVVRCLKESEINAIQKLKLLSYSQLNRYWKMPLKSPGQISIEISTLADNVTVCRGEGTNVFNNLGLNQDDDRPRDVCAICLQDLEIGAWYKKLPTCQHYFHASCIDLWLSTRASCPVCRKEVTI